MKVREFVSMLQKVDQDAELYFNFGWNNKYRKACASICLSEKKKDGDGCLEFMKPAEIKQDLIVGGESEVKMIFGQDFYVEGYFNELLDDYIKGKEI
jgi:hypothetical protein